MVVSLVKGKCRDISSVSQRVERVHIIYLCKFCNLLTEAGPNGFVSEDKKKKHSATRYQEGENSLLIIIIIIIIIIY